MKRVNVDDSIKKFANIINSCRQYLTEQQFKENITYDYAILRVYSSILLNCCEIITLLEAGYPEGALALSRSLYEGLVITDFMIKKYRDNDDKVLKYFFYAPMVSAIKENITILEYAIKESISEETKDESKKLCREQKEKLDLLREELGLSRKEQFNDYWWAGHKCFNELSKATDFSGDYMYEKASNKIHFNASSIFNYMDNSEQGILIGDTKRGVELPLWFAVTVFVTIVGLIYPVFPSYCNEIILSRCQRLYEETIVLLKSKE